MAKPRRRRKTGRVSLSVVCLSLVAVALVAAVIIASLPGFRLVKVDLYGKTSLSAQDIMPFVEPKGRPLFLSGLGPDLGRFVHLRYGAIEDALKARYPVIDRVTVSFSYPSTVRVTLIDKAEVMSARVPEGFALLDSKGVVVSVRPQPSALLPITDGFVLTGPVKVGAALPVAPTQFNLALRTTAALIAADQATKRTPTLMSMTKQITVFDNAVTLALKTANNASWRVELDDNSHLAKNVATLSELLFQGVLKDAGNGTLVLSEDGVVFKKEGDGQATVPTKGGPTT